MTPPTTREAAPDAPPLQAALPWDSGIRNHPEPGTGNRARGRIPCPIALDNFIWLILAYRARYGYKYVDFFPFFYTYYNCWLLYIIIPTKCAIKSGIF